MDLRQRIIEGAHTLFVQYGVRSVSMDDVSRSLSMSKKTLYQYFTNKDELVTATVNFHMESEREEFVHIHQEASNAIEELIMLSKCMREHVFKLNPSLLYDLQKYHADAWEVFHVFKKEFLIGQIVQNLRRGIAEGQYRDNIIPEILAVLRVESVQMIFSELLFPRTEFNFIDVQMQVFDHFVHGILSDQGREFYNQVYKKESTNHSK